MNQSPDSPKQASFGVGGLRGRITSFTGVWSECCHMSRLPVTSRVSMTERGPRFVRRSVDSTGGRLKGKCWLSSTAQCEFSWSGRDLAIGNKITDLVLHCNGNSR
jgi:hypothetical protein